VYTSAVIDIVVLDRDQGTPIRRTYGRVERPKIEYGDLSRFGWDENDNVTIGELPPD
jgi:hypothetical protein